MKSQKLLVVLGTAAVCALMVGCSKAPQQELGNAESALKSAVEVEADKYVADKYQSAVDAMNAAKAEIEKQNAAFALSRNYSVAKTKLEEASKMAEEAKTAASAAKEQMKMEVTDSLTAAAVALDAAKALLAKAPKGKEGKEALMAISEELTAVETSLVDANTGLASGDVIGARDKAVAASAKIAEVTTELSDAIAKTSKK
jgi:hypothetical protein